MQHGPSLVRDVDHPLRVRVPKVTVVRQALVDLRLVERVRDLVREHTRREARDELARARRVARVQDVVVDERVVAEERRLRASRSQSSHLCTDCVGAPYISCSRTALRLHIPISPLIWYCSLETYQARRDG